MIFTCHFLRDLFCAVARTGGKLARLDWAFCVIHKVVLICKLRCSHTINQNRAKMPYFPGVPLHEMSDGTYK